MHSVKWLTYVKKFFVQTNHTYCSPSIGSFYLFYILTGRALKVSSFYVHYIIKCILFLYMAHINQEQLQKRVVQHYVDVANKQKQITVNHFVQEKIPRQTIYSIIRRYEESGYVGDKSRSRRPKKLSRGQLTRLKRLVNKRTGISLRWLAPRFKVSYQTVSNHLKAMGISYYKKQRAQKYINQQLEEVWTRARRLYRMLSSNDFELIMDDEKYFLLQNQSAPTNRGFYTSDKRTTAPQVKPRNLNKKY